MVKLQKSNKGQYVVTISKKLVEAKGFQQHDEFLWQFNKNGNLELVRKK